jgi:hypothetical protein
MSIVERMLNGILSHCMIKHKMKIYEFKVEATNHHGNIKALCEITKKHFDNSQKDFGSGNLFKCKEFKKHPNTKHLKKLKEKNQEKK